MAYTLHNATIAATYDRLFTRNSTVPSTGTTTTGIVAMNDSGVDIVLPLYISTERVGIGTAAPTAGLHVDGGSAHHVPSTSDEALIPSLRIEQNGDNACIDFGTTTSGTNRAYIHARSDRTTYDGSGLPLTLNELGSNVGIGTAAPTAVLHVEPDGGISGGLVYFRNQHTSGDGLAIRAGNSGTEYILLGQDLGGTEKFRILHNGYLGIGTATPTNKLEVVGTAGAALELFHASNYDGSTSNAGAVRVRSEADNATFFEMWNVGGSIAMSATGKGNGQLRLGGDADGGSYQLQLNTDSAAKPTDNVWDIVSDKRIKEDIEPADITKCYEIFKTLELKRFKWKEDAYSDEHINDRHALGFISQDVQKVFPKSCKTIKFEGVNMTIDDCVTLSYGQLDKALYGAVQVLIAKVTALENA